MKQTVHFRTVRGGMVTFAILAFGVLAAALCMSFAFWWGR